MKVQRNSLSRFGDFHVWIIIGRPVNDKGELVDFCEVGRILPGMMPLYDDLLLQSPNTEPWASQIAQQLGLEYIDIGATEGGKPRKKRAKKPG